MAIKHRITIDTTELDYLITHLAQTSDYEAAIIRAKLIKIKGAGVGTSTSKQNHYQDDDAIPTVSNTIENKRLSSILISITKGIDISEDDKEFYFNQTGMRI